MAHENEKSESITEADLARRTGGTREKQKESDSPECRGPAASELSDSYFTNSLCSAQECTGLIPSPPVSAGELESYEELYPFLVPPASGKPPRQS